MKIIDFFANWCGPCHTTKNNLKEFLDKHKDINVEYIDVEKDEDLADSYSVRSLPTIVLFDNENKEIKRHVGLLTVEGIEDFIKC